MMEKKLKQKVIEYKKQKYSLVREDPDTPIAMLGFDAGVECLFSIIGGGTRWIRWSERFPSYNEKVWRIRFSEHGTKSISWQPYKDEMDGVIRFQDGGGYLKTNLEFLKQPHQP